MSDVRIPVTVIGGYLGAGKTTVLNHVLRSARGERFAVLVNDFGAINIDADLIEAVDGDTIRLTNGCVCCSLTDGFATALESLRDGDSRPDRVIVETSGVADPVATAQWAHLPGYRLDGVVVVADADAVRRQSTDEYVGKHVLRQLRGADLLVMSKVDLVDETTLATVRAWLDTVAPDSRVVEAVHGSVPAEVLFDGPTRAELDHTHLHPPRFDQWTFTSESPVDIDRLATALRDAPRTLVRAKGIVLDARGAASVVQMVGARVTIEPADGAAPPSRLVVIAIADHGDELARTVHDLGTMFG